MLYIDHEYVSNVNRGRALVKRLSVKIPAYLTLDTEAENTKHIKDKHESIMSNDLNESDLYERFDEDGNRIVE